MSLLLDALKRAQQIRMEMQQRAQGFGTSLPWLSHWRKRWIIPRKVLLLLGLIVAVALFLTIYKPSPHEPPAPDSQSSSGHIVILPVSHSPLEELKEELTEIPLEDVRLRPVPIHPSSKTDGGGKVKKQVSAPSRDKGPASKPAKSERPLLDKSTYEQMSIQPIPSQEAINHFNLGLLYHKNKKFHEALEEYKKALKIDPLNVQAHNNLGMVHKELGRLPEAISQYQKAISTNPKYEKAHHNLAVAYYLQGYYERALMELKLALDCYPKNPETYNNLGLIYRKQKDLYRAKRIFEKGLSVAPNYGPIHYNLALTLEDEGDWKGAVFHYRRFLDLAPEHRPKLVQKVKRHLEDLCPF